VNSTYKATVEFVFAPEERDVYSYERPPKDLAPLRAKQNLRGSRQSGCAPTELQSKQRPLGYKHLAPLGGSTNNILLHFKLESRFAFLLDDAIGRF
jgi:hypothetical protein